MLPDGLIVDDSRVVRLIARQHFTQLGINCETVESAEDAIDFCKQDVPRLILADWNLTGMSGIDLIEVLKRQHGSSSVYLLTSTERRLAPIRAALRKGADGYVLKPFDRLSLAHRLRRFGLIAH